MSQAPDHAVRLQELLAASEASGEPKMLDLSQGLEASQQKEILEQLAAAAVASAAVAPTPAEEQVAPFQFETGTQAPVEVKPPDAEPELKTLAKLVRCPRCACDLHSTPQTEVTEDDRLRYVVHTISGTPFIKNYSRLRGKLQFSLRSLTPFEQTLCWRQAMYVDRAKPEHQNEAEIVTLHRLMQYRAALQVCRLNYDGQETAVRGLLFADPSQPQFSSYLSADQQHADLSEWFPKFKDWVQNELLKTEAAQNIVAEALAEFDYLRQTLHQESLSADF